MTIDFIVNVSVGAATLWWMIAEIRWEHDGLLQRAYRSNQLHLLIILTGAAVHLMTNSGRWWHLITYPLAAFYWLTGTQRVGIKLAEAQR